MTKFNSNSAINTKAINKIAQYHNSLNITKALPKDPSYIEKRPYKAIKSEIFVEAILQQIVDI